MNLACKPELDGQVLARGHRRITSSFFLQEWAPSLGQLLPIERAAPLPRHLSVLSRRLGHPCARNRHAGVDGSGNDAALPSKGGTKSDPSQSKRDGSSRKGDASTRRTDASATRRADASSSSTKTDAERDRARKNVLNVYVYIVNRFIGRHHSRAAHVFSHMHTSTTCFELFSVLAHRAHNRHADARP